MAVIVRDSNLLYDSGKKVYRDALVSEGTLCLVDLSNLGGLGNFNIKNGATVYNLARETDVTPTNYSVSIRKDLKLSSGKGFSPYLSDVAGDINNANELKGILLGSEVSNYLSSNKTHRSLHIFWLRRDKNVSSANSQVVRAASIDNTARGWNYNVNLLAAGTMTLRVGGALITTQPIPLGDLIQIAVEYINDTTPPIVYVNGVLSRTAVSEVTTYGGFQSNQNVAIGHYEGTSPAPNYFYRMLVEDLTVSGRKALSVVQDDYMYVNGIGKYRTNNAKPFVYAL